MPSLFFSKKLYLIALPLVAGISALAWQNSGKHRDAAHLSVRDTVPQAKEENLGTDENGEKDLDKEIRDLDRALQGTQLNRIDDEVAHALQEAERAMHEKTLDADAIAGRVSESLRNIDFDKISKETAQAMQQVNDHIDLKDIAEQVQHAVEAASDMSGIDDALEKAQKALEKTNDGIQKELDEVPRQIEKAKEELKAYQEMIYSMEKDGLLDTHKDYSIEYTGKELYINHQKQPEKVLNKYRGYFKQDNIELFRKNGRFNINID